MILFFAQQQYSQWQSQSAKSMYLRINDDVAQMTAEDVINIADAFKDTRRVSIASFIVSNTGSRPIVDATLHFASEISPTTKIYGHGVVADQGADQETIEIKPKKNGFDVTFKSLDRGAKQTFWVAYDCCEIFTASPRTENLTLTQSVSDYDQIESAWKWFLWSVVFLFGLGLGFFLDSYINQRMLRKRGYELTELLKRPVRADSE